MKPNIVQVAANMKRPLYDLIIVVETMTKMEIMLDFRERMISIDNNQQPMQSLKNF